MVKIQGKPWIFTIQKNESGLSDIRCGIIAVPTNSEVSAMYQFRYIRGHVEVFDAAGEFLFSADSMHEANEMLEE